MDDGRELPLFKLETTSESHPFYTGTQKSVDIARRPRREVPQQVRAPRRQEVSRGTRPHERQLRLPFLCPRAATAGRLLHHSRHRLRPRELAQPRPRQPARRRSALPRFALLLFCAAYVLPGLFGRDPWKNADITAFGYMRQHRPGQRRRGWRRRVGGLPRRRRAAALLARRRRSSSADARGSTRRWRRASRSRCCSALTLVLTWYAAYHLARTEAAQPLPFAFGGEADAGRLRAGDRRRRLLALIASLGLLQLGHETTPELAQLAARRRSTSTALAASAVSARCRARRRRLLALADPGGERRAEHRRAARRRRRRA